MADDTEHDFERERKDQAAEDRESRRYFEARQYGFSRQEAGEFATGDAEVGELRRLIAANCPVELAVRILAKV